MAILHLLGTGAPASDPHRTTVMLAVSSGPETVLIDCGGDVIQRALLSGIEPDQINSIIITHEHPDHVGGFALLVEKLWLFGRKKPLPVYGPESAVLQAKTLFGAFDTSGWAGLPEIQYRQIPAAERTEFCRVGALRFTSSPAEHGVPTLAIRIDDEDTGGSICYSADTRPCPNVSELASGCGILIHEAGGENPVHSTAAGAAEVARRAQVKRLLLVHLPAGMTKDDLEEASKIFPAVSLAEELSSYEF